MIARNVILIEIVICLILYESDLTVVNLYRVSKVSGVFGLVYLCKIFFAVRNAVIFKAFF